MLFAIVYMTRYLDIFFAFVSYYNSIMKIAYTVCYYVIVMLMCTVYRKSYRENEDTFMTELLLLPSFALALWFNHEMTPVEVGRLVSPWATIL